MHIFKPQIAYKVLEVPTGTKLPDLSPEMKETVKSLQYHPGFQHLVAKLRFHKSQLQHQLNEGFELPDVSLRYLQAGIFWLAFLEDEVARTTSAPPAISRSPSRQEELEFEKFSSNLETVG